MTRNELLAMVDKMNVAAQLPQHHAEYVRMTAEMAYDYGYREGRVGGLETAAEIVEANA